MKQRRYIGAFFIVVLLGLFIRLSVIQDRPVHYDEGVHAYYTWKFISEGTFYYGPFNHGPLMYYLTAFSYAVFSPSVLIGRVTMGIFSLAIFGGVYLHRHAFSKVGLLFSAIILAVHPFVVNVSVFFRSDILAVTGILITTGAFIAYSEAPSWRSALFLGIGLSLALTAKEVSYIILGAISIGFVLYIHFKGRFLDQDYLLALKEALEIKYLWIVGTVVLIIYSFLYMGWPPRPTQAILAPVAAVQYWTRYGTGSVSYFLYYLKPLILRAPAVFLLATVACVTTLVKTRSNWYRWLFVFWIAVVGLILSLMGHQKPWLMVYIFVPVAMLAGVGLKDIVDYIRESVHAKSLAKAESIFVVFTVLLLGSVSIFGGPMVFDDIQETEVQENSNWSYGFESGRSIALQTSCPVLLVGQPSSIGVPWPAQWYLRDIPYAHANNISSISVQREFQIIKYQYSPAEVGGRTIPFLAKERISSKLTNTSNYIILSSQTLALQTPDHTHNMSGGIHIYVPRANCHS